MGKPNIPVTHRRVKTRIRTFPTLTSKATQRYEKLTLAREVVNPGLPEEERLLPVDSSTSEEERLLPVDSSTREEEPGG